MTVDVLLTGFAPFDGADINESWQAVQAAAAQLRADGIEAAQL